MSTTSVTLLQRLRVGDREAWKDFVSKYLPPIRGWVLELGVREQDADDVTHNVFVTLRRKLPEFRYDPEQTFRGWLFRVTHNQVQDFRKSRATRPIAGGDEGLSGVAAPDDAGAVDEKEDRQRLVAWGLRTIQSDFAPKTWKAFWEHGYRGRPAAEVGAEFGMSENAVWAAKFRVLTRLKEVLEGLIG